jgi:DNA-directed RNA polymerase subunit RPC12/RpoP
MPEHVCNTCGKAFPSPSKLRRHQGRLTPCAPVINGTELASGSGDAKSYRCVACGRGFTSASGRSTHSRHYCPAKSHHADSNTELLALKDQVAELERRMCQASIAPISHPNLSIHNNVTINVFGGETWQHINRKRIASLLNHLMPDNIREDGCRDEDASRLFTSTAMLIYSDETHPENLTAYIPRGEGARDKVMVYTGDSESWAIVPLADAVTPMTERTLDLLEDRQPFMSGEHDIDSYSKMVGGVFSRKGLWLKGAEIRKVLQKNGDMVATGRVLDA